MHLAQIKFPEVSNLLIKVAPALPELRLDTPAFGSKSTLPPNPPVI